MADNKAGIIMHLAAFRALWEEREDSLGIGITFFIEGEEEAGSHADCRGRVLGKAGCGKGSRRFNSRNGRHGGGFPHATVLINGAEDPDSRAHGANESIDSADFGNGILAEALFLDQLNGGQLNGGQLNRGQLNMIR
ncbi:hypothetical protein M1E01_12565 [Arthrobacter sp. D1-17]